MKNGFSLELNLTNQCNFSCKYCIQEHVKRNIQIDIQDLCNFIERLKKKFRTIKISFWGGEPTLEKDYIIKLCERYLNDEDIQFYLFTNGSLLNDNFLDFVEKFYKRFTIQISFDGIKIHKENRSKLELVLNRMFEVERRGIPLHLKATIPISMFHIYSDQVLSYMALSKIFNRYVGLSSTVDYMYEPFLLSEEKIKEQVELLKNELVNLQRQFGRENLQFCSFFRNHRSTCSAGLTYFTLDVNGDVYPCHGCLYVEEKEFFCIGNFQDNDIFEKIEQIKSKLQNQNKSNYWQCNNCNSSVCYRCHVYNFLREKDSNLTFYEKWFSKNYDILCYIYKNISSVNYDIKNIQNEINTIYHISKSLYNISKPLDKISSRKSQTILNISKELIERGEELIKLQEFIKQVPEKKYDLDSYIHEIKRLAHGT